MSSFQVTEFHRRRRFRSGDFGRTFEGNIRSVDAGKSLLVDVTSPTEMKQAVGMTLRELGTALVGKVEDRGGIGSYTLTVTDIDRAVAIIANGALPRQI